MVKTLTRPSIVRHRLLYLIKLTAVHILLAAPLLYVTSHMPLLLPTFLTFYSPTKTSHIPIPINNLYLHLQALYQRSQPAT
jgi:hypothetical protein